MVKAPDALKLLEVVAAGFTDGSVAVNENDIGRLGSNCSPNGKF
jgi:hypothetical protein